MNFGGHMGETWILGRKPLACIRIQRFSGDDRESYGIYAGADRADAEIGDAMVTVSLDRPADRTLGPLGGLVV